MRQDTEGGRTSLESDCLREHFRCSWEDLEDAFAKSRFSALRSHRIVVDGKERILNAAVR